MTARRLVIITGNRSWPSRDRIAAELAAYPPDAFEIMHGACPRGADALADEVAHEVGYVVHARPADWTLYRQSGGARGCDAGRIRNAAMAEEAARWVIERRWSSVRGLAFGDLRKPDGRDTGTGGMVALMRARGWPVRHVATPEAEARTIALEVWTSSLKRHGIFDEPDLLDATRGTGGPRGSPFAPTWAILRPALAKLRQSGAVADEGWAEYVPRYLGEMRVSHGGLHPSRYGEHERAAVERGVEPCPEAWANLLAMPRVVIGCHCRDHARCHRSLLATILGKLGAVERGELPAAPQRQVRLPGLE